MKYLTVALLALALSACSDDDSDSDNTQEPETPTPESYAYEIKVTNITAGQPLSPLAAYLAGENSQAWQTGEAASEALEVLAEGGDGSALLTAQGSEYQHAGAAPIGPGGSETFQLSTDNMDSLQLTVATMLVNTNDAFSGLTGIDLSMLEVGETKAYRVPAYDAGTENNTELRGTIPGPADGGEGFNAVRDDVTSVVTYHGGVVGNSDGNAQSILTEANRFDNPVMLIEISRM